MHASARSCRVDPGGRSRPSGVSGFSLAEMLVALALSLVVVGAALTAAQNARRANELATQLLDMNGGLRAAMDLMVRDLIQVGQGLPAGRVIEKPTGAGATPVRRPGPPAARLTFDTAAPVFSAVTVGAGLGPAYREPDASGGTVTGPATDIVTLLYVDNRFDGITCTITPSARVIAVSPNPAAGGARISGPSVSDPLVAGDLIMVTGSNAASGSALAVVTRVAGQSVHLDADDPMNLNQMSGAADGTLMQLLPTPARATSAALSRVRMVTYFLDTAPDTPRLMRQINYNPPRTVAVGVDNLQVSYDLADGVNNPTNVKAPAVPNQIRKVNLYLSARSRRRGPDGQFLRNSLATQVALRSLAFVDRYL